MIISFAHLSLTSTAHLGALAEQPESTKMKLVQLSFRRKITTLILTQRSSAKMGWDGPSEVRCCRYASSVTNNIMYFLNKLPCQFSRLLKYA